MTAKNVEDLALLLIDAMEESLGDRLNTEELGEFWLAATEACTMRLIVLKPEMVRKIEVADGDN